MPQSLAQIYLHIVFSTKDRRPFMRDVEFRDEVFAYLGGVVNANNSVALSVGGFEDHVHLLVSLGREITVANMVRELKRSSTLWIQRDRPELKEFLWQSGYGAFSVSPSHRARLDEYIRNQAEHHKKENYQTEYRRILRKYKIAFDETYVWE